MIILNPETKKNIEAIKKRLPHALLLTGKKGVGLATIANYIAGESLIDIIKPTTTKDEISEQTGSIRINHIRKLYESTRGISASRSVIIIDDADRMQTPAASSFLKLLEEPNSNVHFILTSHNPQNLLDTVKSRVQTIEVKPTTSEQSKEFISDLDVDNKEAQQVLFIATGKPALIHQLSSDRSTLESKARTVSDAKQIISSNQYERAKLLSRYSERTVSLELIDAIINLLEYSLKLSPSSETIKSIEKAATAYDRIYTNGNVKINLASLVL